jgi:hypothetical protein
MPSDISVSVHDSSHDERALRRRHMKKIASTRTTIPNKPRSARTSREWLNPVYPPAATKPATRNTTAGKAIESPTMPTFARRLWIRRTRLRRAVGWPRTGRHQILAGLQKEYQWAA